jgi:hypothetical protein
MDIELKIILKDEDYGFSDLLEGRELNNQTKQEIIELIKEDLGFAFNQQMEIEQLSLGTVVHPKGETPCIIHNTNWNGKCFVCGEQVFVREEKG